MKIRPVVAEFFDADRQTDERPYTMKQIVAFHNFSKRLNILTSNDVKK